MVDNRSRAVRGMELLSESVLRGPTTSATRPRGEINLQWLIHLRWAAIGGQLITLLVVSFGLGIEIPLAPSFAVIAIEFGTNAFLLAVLRRAAMDRHAGAVADGEGTLVGPSAKPRLHALQLGVTLLDTILVASLLGLAGGTANPFCAFLVVYVVLAAVLLPLRHSMVMAVAIGLSLVAVQLYHHEVPGLAQDENLLGWGNVVAVAMTATLSVFFVSRVTSALVKRSEQLEELREKRVRRRHLEALGTLAAGAAHELGTPLSTIAIVAKDLERRLSRTDGSADDATDAQLIRDEVARCRRILGRMANDTGRGMGEPMQSADLMEFGQQVIGELAAASRVDLIVPAVSSDAGGEEGAHRAPRVALPVDGLATSLRAMVQNAIDASEAKERVELALRLTGEALVIEIRDCGSGMTPDEVERALEPFFTTKDVGGGMGLGLYLATSYIESLGGVLEIDSEPGMGTQVRATIPVVPQGETSWVPAVALQAAR